MFYKGFVNVSCGIFWVGFWHLGLHYKSIVHQTFYLCVKLVSVNTESVCILIRNCVIFLIKPMACSINNKTGDKSKMLSNALPFAPNKDKTKDSNSNDINHWYNSIQNWNVMRCCLVVVFIYEWISKKKCVFIMYFLHLLIYWSCHSNWILYTEISI